MTLWKSARRPFIAFAANARGATAIEFALVGVPFFAILLGILELGMIFVTNAALDSALSSFAKKVRTGQILAPGTAATTSTGTQIDLADAVASICAQMPFSASTCKNQLQLDVRPISTFQSAGSSSPVSGTQFNASNLCYYSGNGGDIVQMKAYYLFTMINPLLPAVFPTVKTYQTGGGNTSGNFYVITASQVFKSENYSSANNTGSSC